MILTGFYCFFRVTAGYFCVVIMDIILGNINLSQMQREIKALQAENIRLRSLLAERLEPADEILRKAEVRNILGVCDKTLSNWDKSGKLPMRGIGGRRYYYRKDVDKLLK